MTDEQIIDLFFARSEQGIRELDAKYGKFCRRLAYNMLGDAQDAEECVSDAYLGAWNAIPPAEPHPLLTYLCKIVRNLSLHMQSKKQAAIGEAAIQSRWRRSSLALHPSARRKMRRKHGRLRARWSAFWTRSPPRIA